MYINYRILCISEYPIMKLKFKLDEKYVKKLKLPFRHLTSTNGNVVFFLNLISGVSHSTVKFSPVEKRITQLQEKVVSKCLSHCMKEKKSCKLQNCFGKNFRKLYV